MQIGRWHPAFVADSRRIAADIRLWHEFRFRWKG
jgi:hypothetical protein